MAIAAVTLLSGMAWWLASSRRGHASAVEAPVRGEAGAPVALAPALGLPEAHRDAIPVAEQPHEVADGKPKKKRTPEERARALATKATEGVLAVRISALETGIPLPAVRAQLVPEAQAKFTSSTYVEASRGRPEQYLRTDEQGRLEYIVPQGISYDLWVAFPENHIERMGVPGLRSGERRELDVRLPTERDLRFYGRAVDAGDGRGLAGADVVVRKGARTTTDAQGRFDVATAAWCQDALTVALSGYEAASVAVDPAFSDPTEPRLVRLHRAGSLEVRVGGAGEGLPSKLGVRVMRMDSQRTFDLADAFASEWSGKADADGSCSFLGLPAKVALGIEVLVGAVVVMQDDVPFSLEPGQHRVELRTIASGSLKGRVVDAAGKAVPHLELCFGRAFRSTLQARTDEDGAFRFERAPIGLGMLRVGDDEREWSLEPTEIEISSNAPTPLVTVVAHRSLVIRGRVVDDEGRPCSVRVWATSRFAFDEAVSDADGSFELGPLPPGEFELRAQGDGPLSAIVVAQAGDQDVLVRLPEAGTLRGIVLDERGRPVRDARVVASPAEFAADDWLGGDDTLADGSFRIGRQRPGLYRVIARTHTGQIASAGPIQVVAGATTPEIELRLDAGTRLVLLVLGNERRYFQCTVLHGGQAIEELELRTDEEQLIVVPPGSIEFRLVPNVPGEGPEPEPVRIEVAAGEKRRVEFDLRRSPK